MSHSSGGTPEQREARLAELEQRQRAELPAPDAPLRRWSRGVRLPPDGALPQSQAWLERLYAGDVVPREKKPQVVDTRRSFGPYLVTVDDDPMVLIDACSQIATLTHGFAHPRMIDGIHEGRFDRCLWANPDTEAQGAPELEEYASGLLRVAPAGLEHACFVAAGGAEANEKAFRIARLHMAMRDGGTTKRCRVLAFRHGFHGRTFVSLMATWNPVKREPFELPGYEACFAEATPEGVRAALAEHGDEVYAAIIEPMMAEGGDVHLERETLLAIREATRERGIPLIADEVQTGFWTGGPFFWWKRLGLGDRPETSPDMLTCAKKAGLGVVLSRWPDPEPSPVSVASALRGLIQLETADMQDGLEKKLESRLMELVARFDVVTSPRVAGTTFAFDLPGAAARDAFIDQRFQRGFMTYPAGERTIRFRLNAAFEDRVLDDLFARVAEALVLLERPEEAQRWHPEGGGRPSQAERKPVAVRVVEERDWKRIMEIEYATYEAARVDPEESLRKAAANGLGLVAVEPDTQEVLGFSFAGPIEKRVDTAGPDRDEHQGRHDTLYSADVTVSAAAQGRGVGRALKEGQLAWAREHGFGFVTGRNRVGATDSMMALNASLGAYVIERMENQYEGDAQADYYRIPLGAPASPELEEVPLDLASGLQSPFGPAPAHMATRELVGPTSSRLNLSNWTTPDIVHYVEHLREVLPRGMGHLYFTSSRDETVDKSLRCLKLARPAGRVAIGLDGGYVGHNTAAARSISDPAGFGETFALFDWPRVPHPADDAAATATRIDAVVAEHGADAILGVYAEVVGERSGKVLEGECASALAAVCKKHDLPLVLVETASALGRAGGGPWGVDALPDDVTPDAVLWYCGGQLGHVFVGERYWQGKPLTLISTWDGDELGVIQTHEALRAAARMSVAPAAAALRDAVRELAAAVDGKVGGRGLYRTVTCDPARAEEVLERSAARGLAVRRGAPGVLVFCPRLDVDPDLLRERLVDVLREVGAG